MKSGILSGIVGLAVLVGAAGCGGEAESSARVAVDTPIGSATTAPSASRSGSATAPAGRTGSNATSRTTTGRASAPPSSGQSPTVSLTVVQQPSCPVHGTPDAPFSAPGTDLIISWTVTGADGAALAIDDPTRYAAYGTYDATGRLDLAFPCDTEKPTTKHTYTVWPAGHKNISKSVTVSAQSNP
jgi:hypothetical protein